MEEGVAIALRISNGKIDSKTICQKATLEELSLAITHLEILKQNLLFRIQKIMKFKESK